MQILGIDNVFFQIGDIEKAIIYYEQLGFKLKMRIPQIMAALFAIGNEEPGLILRETATTGQSRLWVEVPDASDAQKACEKLFITGRLFEIATGFTFEIEDPWGNIIGFADYTKNPALSRNPPIEY
jgi:catechol 2,3-dioxygenase-like lactoylglutathione lyase family enzyme